MKIKYHIAIDTHLTMTVLTMILLTEIDNFSSLNNMIFILQFRGTSELIVTCQKEQIRIWALKTMKELKRQTVANMTCNAIALACNGTAIVSGI
jgi:hypothetical protein